LAHASAAGAALVLDFDGTIAMADVGDELCERFAPAEWADIDARWLAGELSLDEAQRQMWRLVRADAPSLLRFAVEIGPLRPGLDALLEHAASVGAPATLASGGFRFYIDAILGARLGRFDAVYANEAALERGGVEVHFPHKSTLGCARCAVCKGRVCDAVRRGGPVLFVGDGASDRCAIGKADLLFAIAGSRLEAEARAAGALTAAITRLDEVIAWLPRTK
jgi:2,3-diketo-5-methylthio-1-phosphopentane phosphatase